MNKSLINNLYLYYLPLVLFTFGYIIFNSVAVTFFSSIIFLFNGVIIFRSHYKEFNAKNLEGSFLNWNYRGQIIGLAFIVISIVVTYILFFKDP